MAENFQFDNLKKSVKAPLIIIGVLWFIHLCCMLFNIDLTFYGVYPRRISGLKGILFSPLIHSDLGHIFNNTFPLLVSGIILNFSYRKIAVPVTTIIYLFTGFAVWLFAHRGFHIGASGVAYGLVSFVFFSSIFRRDIESIIFALIVIILYSGMIVGIFPEDPNVSWESHLFGAIMGLFTAVLFSGTTLNRKRIVHKYEERTYYFERDVFDKTLAERKKEQELLKSHFNWTSTKE